MRIIPLVPALASVPLLLLLLHPAPAPAGPVLDTPVRKAVDDALPRLLTLYHHLHANPELSGQEEKTSARVATELRESGFDVTTGVGGHGVVGVLRNGPGPTLLIRADMDALPVKEQTGAPYASKARARDAAGELRDVMHACGHDVHVTCLAGVTRVLARLRTHWTGTLVAIGQPAEEKIAGAKAMLADGLFTRFPRPDYCVALHAAPDLPAGMVGLTEGDALASSHSVDIVVRGLGGHGAMPHKTKDPVVLAAQIVLALQTIVSREIDPLDPAVVTVGSIHGGTKHNIIPDDVRLQLTIRSYSDAVRDQTVAAIRRIARGIGLAAGLPKDRLPDVTLGAEGVGPTLNDPGLTRRLAGVFRTWLGPDAVETRRPTMGAEDFGLYGRTDPRIPICFYWLGVVERKRWEQSRTTGQTLPGLHSPLFCPDPEPTIRTGVLAMSAAALELLGRP